MKIYIFDASILGCLLFNESNTLVKKINKLVKLAKENKIRLVSPNLLSYEISNMIKNHSSKEDSKNLFNDFISLPIELVGITSEQMKKILEVACDYNVTTYDASYHYLAKFLDGTFVTCDGKYYQKVKELGSIELVK